MLGWAVLCSARRLRTSRAPCSAPCLHSCAPALTWALHLQDLTDGRPDFAVVYAFLGSLFDEALDAVDHAKMLHQDLPLQDRRTVQTLLANLTAALRRPETAAMYAQARPLAAQPPYNSVRCRCTCMGAGVGMCQPCCHWPACQSWTLQPQWTHAWLRLPFRAEPAAPARRGCARTYCHRGCAETDWCS